MTKGSVARVATGVARKPRRTQAERVAESDRRMLDAAARLIAEHGYSSMTLDAIGAEAACSRQLITQRFGSKDKLLESVIARHVQTLRHRFESQHGRLGLLGLYGEIDSYLGALDNPSVESKAFFVLMLESVGPALQFRALFAGINQEWERSLAEHIAEGQRAGALRAGLDPQTEAQLLIATLRGVRIRSLIHPECSDVASAINSLKLSVAERFSPVGRAAS